jgi:hypothetical protein
MPFDDRIHDVTGGTAVCGRGSVQLNQIFLDGRAFISPLVPRLQNPFRFCPSIRPPRLRFNPFDALPLQQAGKIIVVPSKPTEQPDENTIKTAAEPGICDWGLFRQLKQFRAIATRYDKRATNFLGTIYLAVSMTWRLLMT